MKRGNPRALVEADHRRRAGPSRTERVPGLEGANLDW
jgi:hypothetical protein